MLIAIPTLNTVNNIVDTIITVGWFVGKTVDCNELHSQFNGSCPGL